MLFSWYCVLLLALGISLPIVSVKLGDIGRRRRANIFFGLFLVCYSLYLIVLFHSGSLSISLSIKIVLAPLLVVSAAVKSISESWEARQTAKFAKYEPSAEPPRNALMQPAAEASRQPG